MKGKMKKNEDGKLKTELNHERGSRRKSWDEK
jgi:hypothetical protein